MAAVLQPRELAVAGLGDVKSVIPWAAPKKQLEPFYRLRRTLKV